ncbi:MAG: hypothetical protein LAN18_08595 [Acidobacteriia bacterium]|nr:hypothetical protein [Terriglobia bacterium]
MSATVPGTEGTGGAPDARIRSHLLILTAVFLMTLPFVNPLVHGDGVGYYAYARAPLIQHNLRFEMDWRNANLRFSQSRLTPDGNLLPDQYTRVGYVSNLFSVGPAMLWAPFMLLAHATVLIVDRFGGNIPADGFSLPYRGTAAVGTAVYGFCGLLLCYSLARKYTDAGWALMATLGVWVASSLPVYMYFNPFWSHAHSAFTVALFLWYWDLTRPDRTLGQWLLLGLISGLMLDVYFVNGVFLLVPLVEAIQSYIRVLRWKDKAAALRQFSGNVFFLVTLCITVLPTLITRRIIFGGMFRFGSYSMLPWDWRAPHRFSVLFSSDHGLLSWTPLLGIALLGLFLPSTRAKTVKASCALGAVAFYYVISCYPYWDGLSSFGNRFFISVTPIFVLGLALFLERMSKFFRSLRAAYVTQAALLGLFALWNVGFILQWGTHMVPARGEISWREMAHNQFVAVPLRLTHSLETYFLHRKDMMQHIEQEDIEQQRGLRTGED